MRHFPIYLDLDNQTVVISGAGETAVAKLRLPAENRLRRFLSMARTPIGSSKAGRGQGNYP